MKNMRLRIGGTGHGIIEYAKQHPGGFTAAQAADDLGLHRESARKSCRMLVAHGFMTSVLATKATTPGHVGTPARIFRPSETDAAVSHCDRVLRAIGDSVMSRAEIRAAVTGMDRKAVMNATQYLYDRGILDGKRDPEAPCREWIYWRHAI